MCSATMTSRAVPGHTHVCAGKHDAGDHFCSECKRYFWTRKESE